MNSFSVRSSSVVGILTVLTLVVCAAFLPRESRAAAEGTTPITGWGWSDTIGWISFDCSDTDVCDTNDYGVGVDSDGNLSGYAWSDNVGWISANSADLSGCPSGSCSATLIDGTLSGWMNATAASGDGWDGWISLSGDDYGPTVTDGDFSGYAWGSDVVGWVDFAQVNTTYLTDVCPNIGGVQSEVPQDYALQGGICVQCIYTCPTLISVHNSCTGETTQCTAGLACSAGSSICVIPPGPSFNSGQGHSGHLEVRPRITPKGRTTKLFWDVGNVLSCTVEGGGGSWSGIASPAQGQETEPIYQRTTFTMNCEQIDGGTLTETAVVNVVPTFKEL